MARPKSEEVYEPMNFRVEKALLEKIEKVWRMQMYRNRTAWITEAIEDRLEAVVCPFCGARNPRGGRVCSVCLRPLTVEDEVSTLIKVTKINRETGEEEDS